MYLKYAFGCFKGDKKKKKKKSLSLQNMPSYDAQTGPQETSALFEVPLERRDVFCQVCL